MRHTATALACAVLVGSPLLNQDARGGAVALTRESGLQVVGFAEDDSFSDTSDTSAFGPFSDSISGSAGDTDGTHSNATAQQQSDVDVSTPGVVSGSTHNRVDVFAAFDPNDLSGPLSASGFSDFVLEFEVTEPGAAYDVSGTVSGIPDTFQVRLLNLAPGGAFPVFNVDGPDPSSEIFERSGELVVSTYRLIAEIHVASSGSSPGDPHSFGTFSELDIDFTFGTADAPVIPLPPAVWTGAVGLMFAAGAMAMNRRRRIA